MVDLVILIPAAGASSRMRGRDKLLEEVDGIPQLVRCVGQAVATGWPVVVALSADFPKRAEAIEHLPVTSVVVTQPDDGMAASIRQAMVKVPDQADGVMILPADMPDLKTVDLQYLAAHFSHSPERAIRAAGQDGTPGHPVIFPRRLFAKLRALPNAEGARAALEGEDVALCPLSDDRALTDLDTPEDWERWRENRNG